MSFRKNPGCSENPQTDIDKFCCDPESVQVDESTADYYRRLCAARQDASDYWDEQLSKFGEGLMNIPESFIMGILSPEGLEMLGLALGIDLSGKFALNAILRGIAKGVGSGVMDAAGVLAAKEGAIWANNVILTTVLAGAVKEGSLAAIAFRLTKMLSTAVSRVANILAVIQLLGMILDNWDPKGYNEELDAATIKHLVSEFNRVFQATFMNQVPIGSDEFGKPIYPDSWPIEYIVPIEESESEDNLWLYIVEYLDHLKFNSDGYPIIKPPGGDLIFPDWGQVADNIFLQWTSGNTVAANYLHNEGRKVIGWIGLVLFAIYIWYKT
jgi:hypothetical protein